MAKLVVLKRKKRNESRSKNHYFIFDDEIEKHEELLRKAALEYFSTKKGMKLVEHKGGKVGWGDAVAFVPETYWERVGVRMDVENKIGKINGNTIEIEVDEDEILRTS